MSDLPDRFSEYCREAAQPWGVSAAVHPADFMLRRIIADSHYVGDPLAAARAYFDDGASCAARFGAVVYEALGMDRARPLRILEFASGYGRVSRHLRSVFPSSTVVAADVHDAAVRFTEDHLGIASVLSPSTPEQLSLSQSFDVIFALSFFTHMPHATFGRWISVLFRHLTPGGFLIFTTSGRRPYEREGLDPGYFDTYTNSFIRNSEQLDIDFAEYGTMYVTPSYVIGQVWEHTRAPMTFLQENFWWDLQDLYVLTRPV